MQVIHTIIVSAGAYAPFVFIALIEFIMLICMINGFCRIRRQQRKLKEKYRDGNLYYRVVSKETAQVQILLRRSDVYPVFITGNTSAILGISPELLQADIGRLFEGIVELTEENFQKRYERWDGAKPLQTEFRVRYSNKWMELVIDRVEGGDYDFLFLEDITEQKQEQFALEEQLKEAEDSSISKTEFLSRMSHEIRTPMNGIIGMMALAQTEIEPDSAASRYIRKAQGLSKHLLSLINDILDMSRIEAGKMELEHKPFSITGLGDALKDMYQKIIEDKGIRFSVVYQNFDVDYVVGDKLRISQVLLNFLSNAAKFTSQGEIVITFRQMIKENGIVSIMIKTHDTGIGMAPEFIKRIFRPFEQESMDVTKRYGGSGLGMAITDQIVSLMGGEIVIDSVQDKGTDFTLFLRLPVASKQELSGQLGADAEEENTPETTFTYEGKRILMAEDNEINAEIAVSILEMEGAFVEVAHNGLEAVEMFKVNPQGYYDFILMDIQMPIMDGRSAAKEIRLLDRTDAGTIPIFALSADAFVEDERESIRCGMNGHFSKPIDFEAVGKKIGSILQER